MERYYFYMITNQSVTSFPKNKIKETEFYFSLLILPNHQNSITVIWKELHRRDDIEDKFVVVSTSYIGQG